MYLPDGVGAHAEALATLGPHSTGVGCIYLPSLDQVDLKGLEAIITSSCRTLTAGTFTQRARDGGDATAP
ncbi:hypothetical protein H4W27_000833 [Nesterenkonia lutea]|uniref:Uncharacterized protein n=1 Tax=Nesterenkonia lutea TaxID=272919 RepID=A0ABR9JCP9_9MICC|nr:DUF1801 domain-containing protein [Nesterenkonia lutea]MBE1523715.1 hypothetical protein [Nesterenkonia lutea]